MSGFFIFKRAISTINTSCLQSLKLSIECHVITSDRREHGDLNCVSASEARQSHTERKYEKHSGGEQSQRNDKAIISPDQSHFSMS